jgi:hypothetical protein
MSKDAMKLPPLPAGYISPGMSPVYSASMMRDYAEQAVREAQQEPVTDEENRLQKALVYVAHALHATPQHMLAKGITLVDGDTVRVSLDGWTVEASNKATPRSQHSRREQSTDEP